MRLLLLAMGAFSLWRFYRRRGNRRRGLREGRRHSNPTRVTYEVVEHDGGWAYKVGDVFSESYATRREAENAAEQAAAAHESAGTDEFIEYQDRRGRWHSEMEPGDDRPQANVSRP